MGIGKMRYGITCGIFAALLWTSCHSGNEGQGDSQVARDTLRYKLVDFYENSPYFIEGESGIDTTYFKASYPSFENDKINQLLRSSILIDGEDSVRQAAESFLGGFNEFVEDAANPSYHIAWFRELHSYVVLNNTRILSIATQIDDFSGGAHGNHVMILSNFDILNNKKITLPDLISKEKQKELLKIAEKYFRKAERLKDNENLSGKYFFEDGKYALAENFALEKDSLLFYYNPYEIKSYVEGSTALRIPYQEIEHLLTDSGKVYLQQISSNQPKT
ncbi:DUF3298 domain-containing protein [Sphingobacterium spiritivorum]|nr:DUF3298 and DUF4163 domain-containing protein [Sphingobacterium spiritivorum]QQT35529.1 DUF3298 domain-containing protein [Sphingobacterium spiritivorum]WQD32226.1 DUF4163 domain-containing protein [Sphingobacterium spiritivorum]SUJ06812.1 Protein of uncharacterised function (DUF3298) [Sphingobacterium spiritivorum]